MEQAKLQKQIMRRVYMSFAVSRLTHPLTTRVLAALVLLTTMSSFVSFKAVFSNMLEVPVGSLDTFFLTALANTEAWTLFLIGGLLFVGLTYRPLVTLPARMVRPI